MSDIIGRIIKYNDDYTVDIEITTPYYFRIMYHRKNIYDVALYYLGEVNNKIITNMHFNHYYIRNKITGQAIGLENPFE